MKLISFRNATEQRAGLLTDRGLVDLHDADSNLPKCMKRLIRAWESHRATVQHAEKHAEAFDPTTVDIVAPIPQPDKVICIGLNYADHAAETGAEIPSEPVVFNKFPQTIIAHGETILLPPNSSQVDYEAELVVIIGKAAKNVSRADAMSHVFGYSCGHDVSARDWQKGRPGGQWLLGKTFDTFAPLGPAIVTADEIDAPGELDICLRLNGVTMQQSNTRQLIFGIEQLIEHLSSVVTLVPGDVIFTGTPPGVGAARKPPVFLKNGDTVEVEIQGVGLLVNHVATDDGRDHSTG